MNFGKTGILIVNLGTPDAPTRGAVYKYLKEFLLDRRVIDYNWLARNLLVRGIIAPFRSGSSAKLYKELWTENGSPLKYYGERLVEELDKKLDDSFIVRLAMRYQSPSMESQIEYLMKERVSKIIVFPLFPQYASATTGSVHDEVMRIVRKQEIIPSIEMINSYYDHPAMVNVFVENAKGFDLDSYDHILFSFHGLPERQLGKADTSNHCLKGKDCCKTISIKNQHCYSAQCYGTAYAIAEKLNLPKDKYTITFQSRLGPEEWAKPYTVKVLEDLAKKEKAKRLLVFCPAFVADCLETTIEIGVEYQEEFEEWGGEKIDLVPSLNDKEEWIDAVISIINDNSTAQIH